MSLAEILSQFSTQTLDDTDHTIDHQQCQKLQQGESSISSHCQLQTCSSSDSMRALIGLMPEPVANSRHVGWSDAGARSIRKPLPITGDTDTSAPVTFHTGQETWMREGAYKQRKCRSSYAALAMHAVTFDIICSCWSACHLSKQMLYWVFHAARFAHCCLSISSSKIPASMAFRSEIRHIWYLSGWCESKNWHRFKPINQWINTCRDVTQ